MTSKPRFPFGGLVKRLVIATVAILVFSVGALSEETPASGEGEQYVLLSNLGFSYSQNLSSSIVQNYLPTTTAKYAVHFTTGRHPDGYHLNSVDIALLRLVRMDIFVCPLHPTGPLDPLSWQYGSQITNADGDITHTNHVLSNNCSALIAPNPIAQGVNNFQVEGDLTLAANSTYALVFVRARIKRSTRGCPSTLPGSLGIRTASLRVGRTRIGFPYPDTTWAAGSSGIQLPCSAFN